eukprot:6698336-Pyramimonas_sp.AAC.1
MEEISFQDNVPDPPDDHPPVEMEDPGFPPNLHEVDNWPTDTAESDPIYVELAAEAEDGACPDH